MKKKYSLLIFSILAIALLTGCGNKEYDELMKQGKEAIEEDDFEEAVAYFKEVLEKNPMIKQHLYILSKQKI